MKFGFFATMSVGLALVSAVRAEEPRLQVNNGPAIQAIPVRVAPAMLIDGKTVRTGEWIKVDPSAYNEGASAGNVTLCFDAYNGDANGVPAGGQACGLPQAGSRWWFGADYCNVFNVTGFQSEGLCANQQANVVNTGWAWGVTQQCLVGVFTADTFGACGGNVVFDNGYPGILWDFGVLNAASGYYYANLRPIDENLSHQLPTDAIGAYILQYLTNDGNNFASRAQPMLWGTNVPGFCCTGQLLAQEWADQNCSGNFTTDECFSRQNAVNCPNPIGGMISFAIEIRLCTDNEQLLASCDQNGATLTLRNGVPDRSVQLCFIEDNPNTCVIKTIDAQGVATATLDLPGGQYIAKAVLACDRTLRRGYSCPEDELCTGDEKLKAKCKDKNGTNKTTVTLVNGVPGRSANLCTQYFDAQSCQIVTIGGNGKAKIKSDLVPDGPRIARADLACQETISAEYTCP